MKHTIIRAVRCVAFTLTILFSFTARGEATVPSIPDQPAPLIVDGAFQFVEGAWAEYDMLDKPRDQAYVLRVSVLGTEQARRTWLSRRRTYRWMEFDVRMPDQPRVVVKSLARERSGGPGEVREMIIQLENYEHPIRLGRTWLRRNQEPMVNESYTWTEHRVEEKDVTHAGRTFTAWQVESTAEDGTRVEAWVSEALPPLGIYITETPDLRMQLRDWGMDARSAITGEPLGLTRWIYRQVREGMPETEQAQ